VLPAHRQASARRALAGGFGPRLGPDPSVALWQGRWPLPGCARRALAQEVSAVRSGSPCGRHFFGTLLS